MRKTGRILMTDWSPIKIKVVLELANGDEKGLSNKEIAENLDEDASHISAIFKKLRKEGLIIERGRKYSKRTKKGDLDERSKNTPYSLIKDFSQKEDFSFKVKQNELDEPCYFAARDPLGSVLLRDALSRQAHFYEDHPFRVLTSAFKDLIEGPSIYDEQLFKM